MHIFKIALLLMPLMVWKWELFIIEEKPGDEGNDFHLLYLI